MREEEKPSKKGRMTFAGDVFNTAVALARLQNRPKPVSFLTRIGADPEGIHLAQFLTSEGINLFSPPPSGWTGHYLKQTDPVTGERQFCYQRAGSAVSQLSPEDLDLLPWSQVTGVYSTGITLALSPSARETVFASFREAANRGLPVWLDPNIRPTLWQTQGKTMPQACELLSAILPYVTRFLPSLEDCCLLAETDWRWPEDAFVLGLWLNGLSSGLTSKTRLTLGAQGAAWWAVAGDSPITLPCPSLQQPVVDTCGAGDLFNAALWVAEQKHVALEDQLKISLNVASIHVTRLGTLFIPPPFS